MYVINFGASQTALLNNAGDILQTSAVADLRFVCGGDDSVQLLASHQDGSVTSFVLAQNTPGNGAVRMLNWRSFPVNSH